MLRETVVAIQSAGGAPNRLLLLTVEFVREGSRWVATGQELGTSAYADSFEQARAEIEEAVSLQLNEVERLGFSDEHLREHNVSAIAIPKLESPGAADGWRLASRSA
jgi:hypothetical protein